MNRASRQRRDRPQAGPPMSRPQADVRPMAVVPGRPNRAPSPAVAAPIAADFRAQPKNIPGQPSALLPMSAYEQAMRKPASGGAYAAEDLLTVASIGYDFLMAGVLDDARDIFEGLCAVDAKNGYFHLALGLVYDQQGELHKADEYYIKAGQLSPEDPRPDLNRAEIRLTLRRLDDAERYLNRGLTKAQRLEDEALIRKAETMLSHVRRRRKALRPSPGPKTALPARRSAR